MIFRGKWSKVEPSRSHPPTHAGRRSAWKKEPSAACCPGAELDEGHSHPADGAKKRRGNEPRGRSGKVRYHNVYSVREDTCHILSKKTSFH